MFGEQMNELVNMLTLLCGLLHHYTPANPSGQDQTGSFPGPRAPSMPILQLPRVRCFGAFPGEGGRERRTLAHPRANTDSLPSLGGQLSDRLVLALPPTQPHALRPYLPPHRVHGRAWSPEGQGTAKQCLPHQLAGEEDGRGGNIPQRGDGLTPRPHCPVGSPAP